MLERPIAPACRACIEATGRVLVQSAGARFVFDRPFACTYAGLAMFFNVSGMIQEGIGAVRWHQVAGSLRTLEHGDEPVQGEVELLRTKEGVLVRAHLSLEEPETCSRCLRPLQETLPLEFEEEFRMTIDPAGAAPAEPLEGGNEAFFIDEKHVLDLTEAVRQYREASAEMQPLCRPDCRGLCSRCGGDLNDGECSCEGAVVDERLAQLAALLDEEAATDAPGGAGAFAERKITRGKG